MKNIKLVSLVLIMFFSLNINLQAQITKAAPDDFKVIMSRPLIVELLSVDQEFITKQNGKIAKAKTQEKKDNLKKEIDKHKAFVEAYNKVMKEAVEGYWEMNETIEYKTKEEVKALMKAKSNKHSVLFFSESSGSTIGTNIRKGATVPTLNYSRTEKGRVKVDYSFFMPSTGNLDSNGVFVLSDFIISFRIMKNHIEEIQKSQQKGYTAKKYGKDQKKLNCGKLNGQTIYADEDHIKDKVSEEKLNESSENKIVLVKHGDIGSYILNSEDKLITINIPWGIMNSSSSGTVSVSVSRVQYMKSVVNAKTGEIYYVYGMSTGEMYDHWWRPKQFSKMGCK